MVAMINERTGLCLIVNNYGASYGDNRNPFIEVFIENCFWGVEYSGLLPHYTCRLYSYFITFVRKYNFFKCSNLIIGTF